MRCAAWVVGLSFLVSVVRAGSPPDAVCASVEEEKPLEELMLRAKPLAQVQSKLIEEYHEAKRELERWESQHKGRAAQVFYATQRLRVLTGEAFLEEKDQPPTLVPRLVSTLFSLVVGFFVITNVASSARYRYDRENSLRSLLTRIAIDTFQCCFLDLYDLLSEVYDG